jgi:hypothetical protein
MDFDRKYIVQYVKGRGGRKTQNVGVLFAAKDGNQVIVTASRANLTHGDRFDKQKGRQIARDRFVRVTVDDRMNDAPKSLEGDLRRFEARCVTYFKVDAASVFLPSILAS